VAVTVTEGRRRAWSEERGVDEAALRAIESRQLTGEEKARRADLVVQNDGDLDRLREQVEALRRRIIGERGTDGHLR
jgi:dephospho-CoA kinase